MTTRHLVDPELNAILDQLPTPALTIETLGQIRAMSSQAYVKVPQSSALSVHEHFILGPEGAPDVQVLFYQPPQCNIHFLSCSGCMGVGILWVRLMRKISWLKALCQLPGVLLFRWIIV
jgi:hypothetical protein